MLHIHPCHMVYSHTGYGVTSYSRSVFIEVRKNSRKCRLQRRSVEFWWWGIVSAHQFVSVLFFQYGEMEVTNWKSKLRSVMTFKPCGWSGSDLHKVQGYICDRKYVSNTATSSPKFINYFRLTVITMKAHKHSF